MAATSWTQRVILRFVSARTAQAMEDESRSWVMQCECGHTTSIWEMGGIRYKASSKGLRRLGRCAACHRRFFGAVTRRPTTDER